MLVRVIDRGKYDCTGFRLSGRRMRLVNSPRTGTRVYKGPVVKPKKPAATARQSA